MTQYVTVACKLPAGLTLDDGAAEGGRTVTLRGFNHPDAQFGVGLTPNVDKEFFDAWLARHKDFPPVKKGLVYAYDKAEMAQARAAEESDDVKSGFEALDPEKPGYGVEPTDEQKAENHKAKTAADNRRR